MPKPAKFKSADCTYCGRKIFWNGEKWEHYYADPGFKLSICRPVQFATPRRGTIVKE